MRIEDDEPHFTNIEMISKLTGIPGRRIHYNARLSYPCGFRKCCYHMVYETPNGQYAVDYCCGCEYDTLPNEAMAHYGVERV